MTDLGDLLGLPPKPAPGRARARCADPACGRPVYVDQMICGYGRCCAEKRGLIVHRYRLPARHQSGETLLDHLPAKESGVEPFPTTFRIDVSDLEPADAHRKILEHCRSMISDPTGEIAAAYPDGLTAATDDAFRGLVRLLERHAPTHPTYPSDCEHHYSLGAGTMYAWPCQDYRDAAAGLAVLAGLAAGLPETSPLPRRTRSATALTGPAELAEPDATDPGQPDDPHAGTIAAL